MAAGGVPQESSTSNADLVLPIVAAAGAVAAALYGLRRRRRLARTRTTPGARGVTPLTELDARARQALVATDDTVRTSEEELAFATDRFGEEAVRPFADAVAFAAGELTAAFRLRQLLDDAYPVDAATRRRLLVEIVARCTASGRRLDAESEAFDRLRALERNAPEALDVVESAFRSLAGHTVTAEETLAVMRRRYAESAAAPVSGNVEQAKDRLVFATGGINRARQALDKGDTARAAVYLRAAEGAVGQAATLVDAVGRRAAELAEAEARLPGVLDGTDADLADARARLPAGSGVTDATDVAAWAATSDLGGRLARAEAVTAAVRRAMGAGRYDPIEALRRVEETGSALDEALSGARERGQRNHRARVLLDQALLTAGSALGAADGYVATHRGAVGSEARTRLAEAGRHLARARADAGTNATGALAEAQQADALARRAQGLAEQDVRVHGNPYGSGERHGNAAGLGGAVLGGIVLGGTSGAGRGKADGFRPGSFGGGDTRGRRGGGRF
ncbi:TPM domain-containing protein [Streptomyces sannanensis]